MPIVDLKTAGVNIHLICTGGGAGLQNILWQVPGSSAYLSGTAFPYNQAETDRLLGFSPDKYCSEETAIDLACQAYMRAYSFGGKKPVGLGLTASVASEKEHRGDHRCHICVITDDKVQGHSFILPKGKGLIARELDGDQCDARACGLLLETLFGSDPEDGTMGEDWSTRALDRFFAHPYFTTEGKRLSEPPKNMVLYPGAYNPPTEGHHNVAAEVAKVSQRKVVYSVTMDAPNKAPLSLQDMMKRARGLRGYNRLFTRGDALFIDKARRYEGTPIAMGADAFERILDPKWGTDVLNTLYEFAQLGTTFYVCKRPMGDKVLSLDSVIQNANLTCDPELFNMFREIEGLWDFSSTAERAKVGL